MRLTRHSQVHLTYSGHTDKVIKADLPFAIRIFVESTVWWSDLKQQSLDHGHH